MQAKALRVPSSLYGTALDPRPYQVKFGIAAILSFSAVVINYIVAHGTAWSFSDVYLLASASLSFGASILTLECEVSEPQFVAAIETRIEAQTP